MIDVIVRYTVHADLVEENEKLVHAVYDGLRELGNPGIHYATFKQEDGRTFVHVASFDSPEAQAAFGSNPAFAAFQEGLPDRCEVPPAATPLTYIDSFGVSRG